MIGKLTGELAARGKDWMLIDVNGVGYHVDISTRTLAALPDDGATLSVAIETYVREDQIRLFGFMNETERDWFRLLVSVQNVGVRMALAMLGALTIEDIAHAIQAEDKTTLSRAPGVGPKLAQKIILALSDKLPESHLSSRFEQTPQNAAYQDAQSALTSLGYAPNHARQALNKVNPQSEAASAQDLIKAALQELT